MEEAYSQSSPVVYIGGNISDRKFVWYRVDDSLLQISTSDCKRNKKKKGIVLKPSLYKRRCMAMAKDNSKLFPPVELTTVVEVNYGTPGCCTMVGDDIYCFGVNKKSSTTDLLKHDTYDTCPSSWDILSSTTDKFNCRDKIVVLPVGRKLYVFSDPYRDPSNAPTDKLNFWGAFYDLDSHTWEDLNCNISTPFRSYVAPYVAIAKNNEGQPGEILFYSLTEGSVMHFCLASGKWRNDKNHGSLAVLKRGVGRQSCSGPALLSCSVPALLSNYTLYWFTRDLFLYGYDIKLRRWFQSSFLGDQLPTLTPSYLAATGNDDRFLFPFLVDLQNGKFMVAASDYYGSMTVAVLSVFKTEDSLRVRVKSFRPLYHDGLFYPCAEMTMTQLQRNFCGDSSVHPEEETQLLYGKLKAGKLTYSVFGHEALRFQSMPMTVMLLF